LKINKIYLRWENIIDIEKVKNEDLIARLIDADTDAMEKAINTAIIINPEVQSILTRILNPPTKVISRVQNPR
jgi:hypothetical protein